MKFYFIFSMDNFCISGYKTRRQVMLAAHRAGYQDNYGRLKRVMLNEVQHLNGSTSMVLQYVENETRITALRVA
jgi:hypothetical protein